ncbi:LPXTG cell wall anchor domain-containing protein [Lentzea sp. NPDC059081]|uniref:LPXTG cell wall anchor domain-containing protein n=1 Tax=Lentzea sp. NPDC059081 TaxID=3346719 RepID=UPI0036BE4CB9
MASRVLGAFAVAATATIASLALATPASAHTPVSSAECVKDKAVLKVKLTQYAGGNKNTVLIKDNDKVLVDETFSENWGVQVGNKLEPKTFEVADSTVKHVFYVKVTASDGSRYNYEKTHDPLTCAKPVETTKPSETKPAVPSSSVPEAPSSSVAPSSTPAAPAPGGSTPEPPLAATGASPMWLLLSGLGLVGAGAGTLLFLRRRRTA